MCMLFHQPCKHTFSASLSQCSWVFTHLHHWNNSPETFHWWHICVLLHPVNSALQKALCTLHFCTAAHLHAAILHFGTAACFCPAVQLCPFAFTLCCISTLPLLYNGIFYSLSVLFHGAIFLDINLTRVLCDLLFFLFFRNAVLSPSLMFF